MCRVQERHEEVCASWVEGGDHVRCLRQEGGRNEGKPQVSDLRREKQEPWPSWRRSSNVVRDVRAVRRCRLLEEQVSRLWRQWPDTHHVRHARQENQGQAPPVVLLLRIYQPPDGRSHPVAVRVVRPRPAAVRPSRHWPPALVQVVRPGHNAVALHKCAGKCGAYATHGAVGTSRDRLTHCPSCAAKDASLLRGWTGRCIVAECGVSVADGWTHDGCQACQDREKAEAEQ